MLKKNLRNFILLRRFSCCFLSSDENTREELYSTHLLEVEGKTTQFLSAFTLAWHIFTLY